MPLGKVSVKSNNAELALSTLMLGRKYPTFGRRRRERDTDREETRKV